jgi:hypothetical protein
MTLYCISGSPFLRTNFNIWYTFGIEGWGVSQYYQWLIRSGQELEGAIDSSRQRLCWDNEVFVLETKYAFTISLKCKNTFHCLTMLLVGKLPLLLEIEQRIPVLDTDAEAVAVAVVVVASFRERM